MPKKDSHSIVIHSDKISNQNSNADEPKNIRQSSLPPDGGFQVNGRISTIGQSNINRNFDIMFCSTFLSHQSFWFVCITGMVSGFVKFPMQRYYFWDHKLIWNSICCS